MTSFVSYKTRIPKPLEHLIGSLPGIDRTLLVRVYTHLHWSLPEGAEVHRQNTIPGMAGVFRYRFEANDDAGRRHVFTFLVRDRPNEMVFEVIQFKRSIRLDE